MNARMKKKWIKALRSGDYVQCGKTMCQMCQVYLDGSARYCCLGVLTEEVAGPGVWHAPASGIGYLYIKNTTMTGTPTKAILNKAGFTEAEAVLFVEVLISMNDAGETFDEIADFIEEKL